MILPAQERYSSSGPHPKITFHARSVTVSGTIIIMENITKISIREKRRKVWPVILGGLFLLSSPGPMLENFFIGLVPAVIGLLLIAPTILFRPERFVEIVLSSGSPIHVHAGSLSILQAICDVLHRKLETGEPASGEFKMADV